ncbi:MAG: ATP-binding protein [Tepidisphaeraceae bacterium]|jgi:hypothetical protein
MNIEPKANREIPEGLPDPRRTDAAPPGVDPSDSAAGPGDPEALRSSLEAERGDTISGGETTEDRAAMYALVQNTRDEAWMPTKELSEPELNSLRNRLESWRVRKGLSLAKIETMLGGAHAASAYGKGTISQFISGKYKGDNQKVAVAILRLLNNEAIRDEGRMPKDCVEMRLSAEIDAIFTLTCKCNAMAAIGAPSGCGKTFVAKALTEKWNGVYITVNHTFTPLQFLMALAIALGRPENQKGGKAELHRFIVAALKGTSRPVVIDEAHILGKSINFVRGIHDEAEVPIILMGTAEIMSLIDDRGHGAGQFASRTIFYNAIEKARGMATPDDGAKAAAQCLFSIEEVKAFFASRRIRLDKDSLKLAWQLANLPGFGSLRMIERAAAVVFDLAPETETIERDQFVGALRLLHSADFDRMERMVRQRTEQATKIAQAA